MSRIFDNIDQDLLTALRATLEVSKRADFCVGYLNLRGWQAIDEQINPWDPAAGQVCRALVGFAPTGSATAQPAGCDQIVLAFCAARQMKG
jgi:hypothetical protein